jgi:hypothetical protein
VWKRYLPLALIAACSGGGGTTKKDAAIDGPRPDAGPCPMGQFFTGEYIDWDSGTSFCGIFMAGFQVAGDPTRADMTNPNGRFQLCLASATTTRVDITPPTGNSECTSPVAGYTVPGIAIADPAVIASGQIISLRAFTTVRAGTLGVTLDAGKGHVFVHVDKTAQPVQISSAHDTTQYFDGTAWNTTGPTGVNVFFPNIGPGTTSVTMTGGAIGEGSVPVEGGKITYLTLVGN